MQARTILKVAWIFCCTLFCRTTNQSYSLEQISLYYDFIGIKSTTPLENEKDWKDIINFFEKKISEKNKIQIHLLVENCSFGEKHCQFIARSFREGKIEIYSGILEEIDKKLLSTPSYPKNIIEYRKNYIAPIIFHEYCHIQLNHHKLLFENKNSKAEDFRQLELQADFCAYQTLVEFNLDSNFILVSLEILKELYQKRNKKIENRIDFFDYSHLHPSPNLRLKEISEKIGNTHKELYSKLSDLEKIFSFIRRAKKNSEITELKNCIDKLELYLAKNNNSNSIIYTEILSAKTIALHKLWYLQISPGELGLHPSIELPLFSDAPEFSELKGKDSLEELFHTVQDSYGELWKLSNIKNLENYPELLSAYATLLIYSDENISKKKSLEIAKKAWGLKKNFTTSNNYAIILYKFGFTEKSKELFNSLYKADFEKNSYPLLEKYLYQNGERKISALNYVLSLAGGNKQQKEIARKIYETELESSNPWSKLAKISLN